MARSGEVQNGMRCVAAKPSHACSLTYLEVWFDVADDGLAEAPCVLKWWDGGWYVHTLDPRCRNFDWTEQQSAPEWLLGPFDTLAEAATTFFLAVTG